MSGKHNESAEIDNPTDTLPLAQLLVTPVSRRRLLQGVTLVPFLAIPFGCASVSQTDRPIIGFTTIPPSTADEVRVPPGYTASVLYAWGDPTGDTRGQPAFMQDASNSAAEQALQAGMHHDGIHYFPLSAGSRNSTHGLLAINHEYTDEGLLHPHGFTG